MIRPEKCDLIGLEILCLLHTRVQMKEADSSKMQAQ